MALCLGPGPALLDQVVKALATGNGVVAVAAEASHILQGLLSAELPLAALDGRLDPGALRDLPVGVVASADPGARHALRQVLAGRDGPIVGLTDGDAPVHDFVHERAICIDTTAAGGNASLLAAAG